MGESRNVYVEPDERAVIRTADVYQTEVEAGTAGYSDTLLSVVANFKNSGAPEGFNAQCMVGKSKRGEVALRLFAVIDPETETFVRAGFKARGCLAMTACASVVCSMVEGKTFAEALAIRPDDVKEALDGVPWDKIHTAYFAAEGVRALIGDFIINRGGAIADLDAVVPCDELSLSCAMCEHCSLRDARIELRFGPAADEAETGAGDGALAEDEGDAEGDAPAEGAGDAADVAGAADADGEAEARARALAEHNALARVFDDVRAQSADSRLVTPARWAEIGLVPAHLTSDEFEMLVYEHVEDDRAARAEAAAAAAPEPAPVFRTATRAVGVPAFLRPEDGEPKEAPEKPARASQDAGSCGEASGGSVGDGGAAEAKNDAAGVGAGDGAAGADGPGAPDAFDNPDNPDNPFAGLDIPAGYRLEGIEGEYVLVETGEGEDAAELPIDCEHIATFVGAHSYYLYDRGFMTDAYARWAFLAAEDDRMVTFVECVREESRVYPRPLAASSLKNPPFRMTDEDIAAAWEAVRASDDHPDIERTVASNGDAYFFSTDFLSPAYAASLAEWDAVERHLHM
ncbi:iron-sulfur cluster assembly scaffold protein [Rubneribacter sp.]|nr:iron-sulfur cluster assembly scaffold protein [Candidatus Rubneribacter avistercoris]